MDSSILRLTNGTEYEGRLLFDEDGKPIVEMATCGVCGFEWNDALITSITPTPSARCPNEYNHMPAPKEPPTIVIFRVSKGDRHDAYALMPGIDEGRGLCATYQHVGQHSSADYHGCIQSSRPATPQEYRELQRELERIGYNVAVRKRWTKRGHR